MSIIKVCDIERRTCSESIRAHCRECVGGDGAFVPYSEITGCTDKDCKLWGYRHGEGFDKTRGDKRISRLQSIKAECIQCMGGPHNRSFVKDCPSTGCSLWPYRLGRGYCTDPNGQTYEPTRTVSDVQVDAMRQGRERAATKEIAR